MAKHRVLSPDRFVDKFHGAEDCEFPVNMRDGRGPALLS